MIIYFMSFLRVPRADSRQPDAYVPALPVPLCTLGNGRLTVSQSESALPVDILAAVITRAQCTVREHLVRPRNQPEVALPAIFGMRCMRSGHSIAHGAAK
jgi:hypothetical protein